MKVLYDTFDQQALGRPLGWPSCRWHGVLGWLSMSLPTVGMWAVALAGVLLLGYREEIRITSWQRTVLAACAVLVATTVSAALYATWTRVAALWSTGCRGGTSSP